MSRFSCLIALLASFVVTTACEAGSFTGRITELSADFRRLTVTSVSGKKESFIVDPRSIKVSVNRKPGKIQDLKETDLVTVLTSTSGKPLSIYCSGVSKPSAVSRKQRVMQDKETGSATATSDSGNATELWPQFLGQGRKNVSNETGLLKQWPDGGPKLLWTARNLGEGYSSVSVVNGKVFTMGTRAGEEAIFAFDLASGQELWAVRNGTIFNESQGNGPRSTPTYDNGAIYTLGASGDLSKITESGQLVWTINILERFGARNIIWGISESPLINGDHLICTPGGPGATMVALNKSTGDVVWQAAIPQDPQAGYASPILCNIRGRDQYVNFCHSGLFGVDAKTGQALWGDNNASNNTANCSSPIALGQTIFYASGYGTGGALLSFEGNNSRPNMVYKTEKMKNHHGGMVALNGYIYGANDATLTCLNAKTGSVAWMDRVYGDGKGAITAADGMLYFRSEKGPIYLVEATPEEFREKGSFDQPERSGKNAWARPVVADGKLFLRDQDILLCYDLKE